LIYVTTAGGGVWRSKNGGLTWDPLLDGITDPNFPTQDQVLYTSAIAIAPQNSKVLYVALVHPNNSLHSHYGRHSGLLKSVDGGNTWPLLPDPTPTFDQHTISKIVVDPGPGQQFADTIYGAVQGNGINDGPDGDYGIWRFNQGVWTNLTAAAAPAQN